MTISRRGLLASFAATSALSLAGCATQAPSAPRYDRVQAVLDRYVAERKLAGAVVGVGLGVAPMQFVAAGGVALDDAPCDADSIYRIYSMSKPVTAVAALRLIESGRLGLDTPVADFVPEFRTMRVLTDPATFATRPATKLITVRHLMTHSSGLSYHINGDGPLPTAYRTHSVTPGGPASAYPRRLATLDEFATALAELPLAREPGSGWEYSVGLDMLGLVIQRASGQPFADYLRAALFAPLRMNDTSFSLTPDNVARMTSNYRAERDGTLTLIDDRAASAYLNYTGLPAGGAGLLSTARDYGRFCDMLRNGGTLDGARVLSPESARLAGSNLMEPGVFTPDGGGFGAAMQVALSPEGAGMSVGMQQGAYFWAGAAGTLFWIDPSHDLSFVFMTQFREARYALRTELAQAVYADIAA